MSHTSETKQAVIRRRQEGASVPQLADEFYLARSTVSLWVRHVKLNAVQKSHLANNIQAGLARSLEARRIQKSQWLEQTRLDSQMIVESLFKHNERSMWQLTAALLFWCEGGKSLDAGIQFANSDPKMIASFLQALRKGFDIDETKFRGLIHLHSYHDKKKQTLFWMNITGIPQERFQGPYIKPHTTKRKREGYPGCISIRYYDKRLAQKLTTLYDAVCKIT